MKRNTTPTIPIKIHTSFDNVKRVEFIFADKDSQFARIFLHKIFESEIPVAEGDTTESFTVLLSLSTSETMKLPAGEVYMDTRIILKNGNIPETEIVKIDVKNTLFKEVYAGD